MNAREVEIHFSVYRMSFGDPVWELWAKNRTFLLRTFWRFFELWRAKHAKCGAMQGGCTPY